MSSYAFRPLSLAESLSWPSIITERNPLLRSISVADDAGFVHAAYERQWANAPWDVCTRCALVHKGIAESTLAPVTCLLCIDAPDQLEG